MALTKVDKKLLNQFTSSIFQDIKQYFSADAEIIFHRRAN